MISVKLVDTRQAEVRLIELYLVQLGLSVLAVELSLVLNEPGFQMFKWKNGVPKPKG